MNLKGKSILITGGRRVGAQLALTLASRGAHVALSYFRSRERIEAVAAQVRTLGVCCEAIEADLREPQQAQQLVDQAVASLGAIHGLVNMASEFHATPFDKLTPADFDANIASNLKAPYLVAVAAAKAMLENPVEDGVQGKIVNFADWAIDRPYRNYLPYLIAKGGVATMTKALAVELAPTIAVNAVAPAMIDPPSHLTPDDIDDIRRAALLERVGTPADANNLVLYLLEGTNFATGTVYPVDGGRLLGGGR